MRTKQPRETEAQAVGQLFVPDHFVAGFSFNPSTGTLNIPGQFTVGGALAINSPSTGGTLTPVAGRTQVMVDSAGLFKFSENGGAVRGIGLLDPGTNGIMKRTALNVSAAAAAADVVATIALMNHHVRNALQVIRDARYVQPENQKLAEIVEDAVTRIDWALREILPGRITTHEHEGWKQRS